MERGPGLGLRGGGGTEPHTLKKMFPVHVRWQSSMKGLMGIHLGNITSVPPKPLPFPVGIFQGHGHRR